MHDLPKFALIKGMNHVHHYTWYVCMHLHLTCKLCTLHSSLCTLFFFFFFKLALKDFMHIAIIDMTGQFVSSVCFS